MSTVDRGDVDSDIQGVASVIYAIVATNAPFGNGHAVTSMVTRK